MLILQHLLFSVTEPQFRVKPPGVSDVSLFFPSLGISFFDSCLCGCCYFSLKPVVLFSIIIVIIIILSLLSMEVNLLW